jgi:hypothetical protein
VKSVLPLLVPLGVYDLVVEFLQVQDLINSLFELVDILVLAFTHGLVPLERLSFDSFANVTKGLFAYGFVSLIKNVFNNIGIYILLIENLPTFLSCLFVKIKVS